MALSTACELLVALAMVLPAQSDGKTLEQLDRDFEELLSKEPDRLPLRYASLYLEQFAKEGNPIFYYAALFQLKQSRTKAAVPLILKHVMQPPPWQVKENPPYQELADWLSLLTGKSLEPPVGDADAKKGYSREAEARKLAETWWLPNKGKVTIDIEKMQAEDVRGVINAVDRLSRQTPVDHPFRDSRYWAYALMKDDATLKRFQRQFDDAEHVLSLHPEWQALDKFAFTVVFADPVESMRGISSKAKSALALSKIVLATQPPGKGYLQLTQHMHPAMIPVLLAPARDKPGRLPLEAGPMLAAIRTHKGGAELDKLAEDEREPANVRCTCLLALRATGAQLPRPALLKLVAEKNPEHRAVGFLLLSMGETSQVLERLIRSALKDDEVLPRLVGLYLLEGSQSKDMIEPLSQLVLTRPLDWDVKIAAQLLAKHSAPESKAALAGLLEKVLADKKLEDRLGCLVRAFRMATEEAVRLEYARGDEDYRALAAEALKKWKEKK